MKTKNSKTPQPVTPQPVKAITPTVVKDALLQHGYTMSAFAKKLGVSRSNVHGVIKNHCGRETRPFGDKTYKILLALSRELGFPVHRIISRRIISEEDI